MKKMICVFVIFVILITLLCGCSAKGTVDDIIRGKDYYSDTGLYSNQNYKKTLSMVAKELSESNIEDIGSFTLMADLVSRTVWGRAPMKVTFAVQDLRYGGVRTLSFKDLEIRRKLDDNGPWRELYAAKVKIDVINQLKPLQSRFNVVSVIVEWNQKQMFGSVLTHSVCDLNGDGVWDYYSPDLHYNELIDHYDEIAESDLCKKLLLDDQYGSVVVVKSGKSIRDVPPLAHETFYDIQKAMKES